jgi:hypothetical protein
MGFVWRPRYNLQKPKVERASVPAGHGGQRRPLYPRLSVRLGGFETRPY